MKKNDIILSETRDFCNAIMPSEDTKILEFNQYEKFAPFIICADFGCIIEKLMDAKIILKIHLQQK